MNWGSSTQAQTYKTALNSVQHLVQVEDHVKNYRPQILVLSGLPSSRPPLIDFAYLICKQLSLMVCGHVVKNQLNQRTRSSFNQRMYHWFRLHKIKAFYNLVDNSGFQGFHSFILFIYLFMSLLIICFYLLFAEGATALMQLTGLGKMKPNLALMGYKGDWGVCDDDELDSYFGVIQSVFSTFKFIYFFRAILFLP